jgi:MoxR-like ATPase
MIPHDPSRRQIDPRKLVREEGPGALWDLLVRFGYVPQDDVFDDLLQALLGHEPMLIEGIRGGGKTALIDTLAKGCNLDQYGVSAREDIRPEELLYSWDRDEQREFMADARARKMDLDAARAHKWTKEFLLLGEFLGAYDAAATAGVPPLLFMDEIDKAGPAIQDMLLQPLANGVMYVPRLRPHGFVGTHDQSKWPFVFCASNDLRHKLSPPFRSRHVYSYIATPDNRKEVLILLSHVPDTSLHLLKVVVKLLDAVRALGGLDDPPAIRESVKLLKAFNRDGLTEITEDVLRRYIGHIVKSKGDREYLVENLDYVVRFAVADNHIFDSFVVTAVEQRRLMLRETSGEEVGRFEEAA